MKEVTLKKEINADIKKVWEIVTSLNNYSWRSDLKKVDLIEEGKKFIEYDLSDFATSFEITKFEPYHIYAFNLENKNIRGEWTGSFKTNGHLVSIEFTEKIEAKKRILNLLLKKYIKKQQSKYFNDLKKALQNKAVKND